MTTLREIGGDIYKAARDASQNLSSLILDSDIKQIFEVISIFISLIFLCLFCLMFIYFFKKGLFVFFKEAKITPLYFLVMFIALTGAVVAIVAEVRFGKNYLGDAIVLFTFLLSFIVYIFARRRKYLNS